MADLLQEYRVGVILSVEECGKSKGLRACQINIGDEGNPVTVVTSASNVRVGSRVAVAPVGSKVIDEQGEEMEIKSTTVGGVVSDGMLCDSRMLGWAGGAAGIAAQIPESIAIGEAPPSTKPRKDSAVAAPSEESAAEVQGLFEKKLTKEEKKKLAEERKKARKAAKEAKGSEE
ncbi:hypothetical protein ACA910_022017 [Epithemia clementina (nom. ined.)]